MTPGEGVGAAGRTRVLDAAGLDHGDCFRLLIGSVVPRPIAWASTCGTDGVLNLAPFSFFTVVSTFPPMLSLTLEPAPGGGPKDTQRNAEETGEFVVNVVSEELGARMRLSGTDYPPDVDEFEACGVHPAPSEQVKAPRVAEARISMECVLHQAFSPGSERVLIGRVVAFHVDETLLSPDLDIDLTALRPLGRVDNRFVRVTDPFPLP